MMTKRMLAWWAAGLLCVVSLAIGAFGISGTRTIRIGEAEVQKRIDAQLPREYKGVKLTRAMVNLGQSDVHIALSLEGRALGQSFALEATGVGVPEYRQGEEAFYFHPSKLAVARLEFSGVSATDKIGQFAGRHVTDPKLKEMIESTMPGAKRWVEDNLESHALTLFGQMPLYKPKNDMKGIVIKATLESLTVENGALVCSFSLLELTKTVFLCLLTFVISLGMALALLRNPGWGIPLLFLS